MAREKQNQPDLFKADTSWFHVFKDMIDSGDMAKLDGSAIKVYLVIKSCTNFATGMSFPGVPFIAEKAGLSERQVTRCFAELENAGYITKGRAGRKNVYTLREKVNIRGEDGRPQAVATWDYIPNGVKGAMAELKHAVVTGDLVDGRIINIERLVLNVFTDHSFQVNLNSELENIPADIRESLLSLKKSLDKKGKKA